MPRRISKWGREVLVFLVCSFLGALLTHYFLNNRVTETAAQPVTIDDPPEPEQDTRVDQSEQAKVTSLALISLPPPPPAQNTRALPDAASIKPREVALSVKARSEQPVLKTEANSIDTQNDGLIQRGLSLLNDAQQSVPQVLISLPEVPQQREQVINTLRACMGVTLGKVNDRGVVVAQENATHSVSPFLRLVEGKLSRQEQQIAEQWQALPGNIVRFYPQTADAKVLGGLLQLIQGPLTDKKISGEYRIESGSLNLVNININGNQQTIKLRLSENC